MNEHRNKRRQDAARPDRPANIPAISVIQIIGLALVGGAVTFTIVALFLNTAGSVGGAGSPPLTIFRYAWVAALCVIVVLSIILTTTARRVARVRAADGVDDASIMSLYGSTTIMRLALWEGAAILGAIILLLSGHTLDVALALTPLFGMVYYFPTTERWRAFHSDARGIADADRHRNTHEEPFSP